MNALLALIRNDLRQYFSNRRSLLISVAAPIAIAAFFGSLFDSGSSKTPSRISIGVVDHDASEISGKIVANLMADGSLNVQLLPDAEARTLVNKGKLAAALILPKEFGEQAARALFRAGEKPTIEVDYDPSQSMALAAVRGLLAQHAMSAVAQAAFGGPTGQALAAETRQAVQRSTRLPETQKRELAALLNGVLDLERKADKASNGNGFRFELPFTTREQELTSDANRKYNGYAHSFAGMGVQFILFMGIDLGIGLLLARRLGLWKRLRAAPVPRSLLLVARIASGALIAGILLTLIYAAALAFFGVRVDGSLVGFLGVAIAFCLMASSFGLLVAALGKTPEASRGIAIFATLLLVMLGGAWVPTFVFPEWLQTVSLFAPTRWAVDGFDAMTWRGLGIASAAAPVGVMLASSAVFAAVAVLRFDWEE
jgi:ABC-2 type transport system permease protein